VRDVLPTVPIPLDEGQTDVFLDLSAALDAVQRRSHYDRMLRYEKPLGVRCQTPISPGRSGSSNPND
jgi:hypothetical protein